LPSKWPIIALNVEGNHRYQPPAILAVAGLKVGQVAGKEEFDAARERLMASGYFEMAGYKFDPATNQNGIIGTFQVNEVDMVYPARFEDLGFPAAELEKMLRARDPLFSASALPATKPVLDRLVSQIQEYLTSKGSQEKVAARVTPGAKDLEIMFRPARNLPSVAQVTFVGNQALSQDMLRDAIAGVAVGSPYTEEHFRELLNTAVRPVYEAHGRLRVTFPKVTSEPAKDVQGLHVTVTVNEGEAYQLGKVGIVGATPVDPAALLKAGAIQSEGPVNFDQVSAGLEKMRKALLRAGFLDGKVTAERKIDDAMKTVDLGLHVDSGPRYLMGKLNIVGLDLNGDYEMKRIWSIKEGKPFNAEYPDAFLNSVREQGLFDNLGQTKAETQIHDQDHTVDVTLTFGGAPPPPKKERQGGFGPPLP